MIFTMSGLFVSLTRAGLPARTILLIVPSLRHTSVDIEPGTDMNCVQLGVERAREITFISHQYHEAIILW